MKTCANCGSEVLDNAKFCNNCGSEIVEEETVDSTSQNKCPNCGEEIDEGMKFCRNCGSEISHDADEVKQTKFCRNCGCEMGVDMKFCPECGVSMTGNIQNAPTQSVVHSQKSPILAAILSFLIIGLGQVYLGLTKKGIILFVLAIVSGFLMLIYIGFIIWFLVWVYAIYDGYNSANKINEGTPVEDTLDFNNLF